uniref:Zinc finger Y-chromosomal protein n=1 Tax=Cacopsylla melanoneura TaxID=428564 RepID=A0A8D9ESS7_9HEMI
MKLNRLLICCDYVPNTSSILFAVSISENLVCHYCSCQLVSHTEFLLSHGKSCSRISRPDKSFLYVCVFCEYHSNNSGHMRGHIRKHIGDKPYNCRYCLYKSSRLDNLTTHVKLKHSVEYDLI